jgi:hypothetical protein
VFTISTYRVTKVGHHIQILGCTTVADSADIDSSQGLGDPEARLNRATGTRLQHYFKIFQRKQRLVIMRYIQTGYIYGSANVCYSLQ